MITASNQLGKATSTAHVTIEAASSDEEFAMKTVTSTKKTVTSSSSVQSSKMSVKKTTKTTVSSESSLPPGLNPTDAQKQFASVFASVGGTKKKKKVKKPKVDSSAETDSSRSEGTSLPDFSEEEQGPHFQSKHQTLYFFVT